MSEPCLCVICATAREGNAEGWQVINVGLVCPRCFEVVDHFRTKISRAIAKEPLKNELSENKD